MGIWAVTECEFCTWYHAVQALDVLLCDAALCAHLVDEARDKPDHRVGHVAVFGVLKPAFCIKALRHTPGDAEIRSDNPIDKGFSKTHLKKHYGGKVAGISEVLVMCRLS